MNLGTQVLMNAVYLKGISQIGRREVLEPINVINFKFPFQKYGNFLQIFKKGSKLHF